MIRVCYVIPTLRVGGTERQLVYLMGGLVKDHDIAVICTREDGALAGDARRLGVSVRVVGSWGGWDLRLWWTLRRLFRHYRPDIVHTFMFGFDYPVNRAARETGVPVVVSSRRELATWMKPRHLRFQRKANGLVDAIVANSQAVAHYAIESEKAEPALFHTIPNGMDAEAFVSQVDPRHVRLRFRLPFHTHIIGMVANFSPIKDHALFLDMAKELIQRRADLHFLLVGTGPLRSSTERRIASMGMERQFTCVASLEEVPDLYKLMDVSVLCSKVEGFPNVVMEAMAAGTPVVAPAVGGIPEIVHDKENGLLVPSRDPRAFADAVESILEHPGDAAAMAGRAAAYIRERHSVDGMVKQYRTLYAALLARAGKRRK